MSMEPNTSKVIERLGGTTAVAKLCEIKPASVSEWKQRNRIPKGWLKYFKVIHPEVFESE